MRVYKLTVKRTDQPCGLHACLRHALRLARWAGFFPVQGLEETSAHGTSFNLKCIYSCYCIATLIGQVGMFCLNTLMLFHNEINLSIVSDFMFYATGLTSVILLLKLSKQWPVLIAKVAETERALTELKLENKTIVQATVITYVIMALALVEHILLASFNINFVMSCLQETEITSIVIENYVKHWIPYVFNYVSYSAFSASLSEYICLQVAFLWSFNDVIVTCFSIYITAYFQNLNKVIASNVENNKDTIPWGILRVHYSSLVKLVREIDAQISSFILIAFFNDLFYMCLQLFYALHPNHVSFKYCDEMQTKQALTSPIYLVYYLYSFAFLVLRTLMLSLFASKVHCAALEPVYTLCEVPSSVFDIEVRRFQLQLHHNKVALSGKFFKVTKNMILKVVSTIITYEIVLLQYSITPKTYYNHTTMATIVENVTNVYGQN